MRIALDTMGGDKGPEEVCRGAVDFVSDAKSVTVTLWGPRPRLQDLLDDILSEAEHGARLRGRLEVEHAPDVITQKDEPVAAVREKKNSSMIGCFKQARDGKADALVTVGNTGAALAAGVLITGRIADVERPALASEMPIMGGGRFLLLDLGANADARPQHLSDYAQMGLIYASEVMEVAEPTVGLLNIGTEKKKGDKLRREAYPLLEQVCSDFPQSTFLGNIESRRLLEGSADVVVTDGFVGNILLKTFEGVGQALSDAVSREMKNSLLSMLGGLLVKPGVERVFGRHDYRNYGGAVLLGLRSLVVKCHGVSQAKAISSALQTAYRSVEAEIPAVIDASMKRRNQ